MHLVHNLFRLRMSFLFYQTVSHYHFHIVESRGASWLLAPLLVSSAHSRIDFRQHLIIDLIA
jgi:hypothetical protein